VRKYLGRVVAAAAVGGCLLAAAVAFGSSSNISIQAINHDGPNARFKGAVTSTDSACKKDVKVTLYHDPPGAPRGFHVADTVRTDRHGKWAVHYGDRIPRGKYYASTGGGSCPLAKTTKVKID
jgi:hypothetical protein